MSAGRALSRKGIRVGAIVGLVALAATSSVIVSALGSSGAAVTAPADRVLTPQGDMAVIFDVGDVDRAVVDAADAAAEQIGAAVSLSRSGSLGMKRLERAGQIVHAPPSGHLIPMVYIALPEGAVGPVMGADVPASLSSTSVILNEVTAETMGAAVGDVIVMQAANASAVPLTVSGIRPYEQVGWAELVMTFEVASRLGATTDTRVVIYDIDDRDAFDAAIDTVGLSSRRDTRVNRSWSAPDPDDTLSTARTKVLLGEPWYRFNADGSISMHSDWKSNNLMPERALLDSVVRVRARCHVAIEADLRAALAAVGEAGLAYEIDTANTNTYGGCYVPRFSRVSGQIGFLSRHAYGMAIDMNTLTNCAGCRPRMDCEVVRIFRRHGFAWGGNFRRPDGMHFEWVGERRDQIDYPSTYCPNIVEGGEATTLGVNSLVAGMEIAGHEHHEHDQHEHHDHDHLP